MVGSGFVGRERELAVLAAAVDGPPCVMVIDGEAGVGKTRLLRELLAGRGDRALVAGCPPFREPYTLGPIVDALRSRVRGFGGVTGLSDLAGALRPLFPDWAADLPPAPDPLEGDPRATRHRVFRALDEVLGRLDVSLLAVEDAHWADEATVEFLLFLAAQRPMPVSVAVTYRPEELPEDSLLRKVTTRYATARCALRPLNRDRTAELAAAVLGGDRPVTTDLADLLHHHTGGLPFVLSELVRLMHEQGDVVHREDAWTVRHGADVAVPLTVRDTVLERVGRRGRDAVAVLRAAAVLAAPAPATVVLAVSGLPAHRAEDALGAALESALLHEDGRGLLAFGHALAARAVYQASPPITRRAMHRRAARLLEHRDPVPLARLAHHFRAAGDSGNWCHYAEAAADHALASADEVSAAALLYDAVVEALPPAPTMVRLIRKLPSVALSGPHRFQGLVDALRRALARDRPPPAQEAFVREVLGRVLLAMDDSRAGRIETRRALIHLPPDSPEARWAMSLLAWPRGPESGAAHRYWLRQAAPSADLPAADWIRLAMGHSAAQLMLGEPAGWAEMARIARRTQAPAALGARAMTLHNTGNFAILWGRLRLARRSLSAAARYAERNGFVHVRHLTQVTEAHLRYFTGEWTGLAGLVRELAGDPELHPMSRMEALLVAGLVTAAGGGADAADLLDQALAEGTRRGATEHLPELAAARARLTLASDGAEPALAVTDGLMRTIAYKEVWLWASDLAPVHVDALVAAGRTGAAAEVVTAFAAGLPAGDAPAAQAGLTLSRAILAAGRDAPDRAADLFAAAAAQYRSMPRPYDALLATERQAYCLVALGEAALGRDLLAGVHSGLLELGAGAAAQRVAAKLAGAGSLQRGRGRPSYGVELSPRELQVVGLVVAGYTNRQIAADLVMSTRTAGSHVASAMRKLQVASRTALAVRAVELGLTDAPGQRI